MDKSLQLPIKSRDYTTISTQVDNLGNIYVLAKVDKEKDERAKDQSKYYYKIIVINNDETPKEFDLPRTTCRCVPDQRPDDVQTQSVDQPGTDDDQQAAMRVHPWNLARRQPS